MITDMEQVKKEVRDKLFNEELIEELTNELSAELGVSVAQVQRAISGEFGGGTMTIDKNYQRTASARRCRFCESKKCYTRIHTRDRAFDELACRMHVKELEIFADATLQPGANRIHSTSSGTLERGVDDKIN